MGRPARDRPAAFFGLNNRDDAAAEKGRSRVSAASFRPVRHSRLHIVLVLVVVLGRSVSLFEDEDEDENAEDEDDTQMSVIVLAATCSKERRGT